MNTIESICNAALDQIGYKRHIGSVWEGSLAARVALNVWSETRDAVLRVKPWPFAMGELSLTSVGVPPVAPWAGEYIFPAEFVALHQLRPSIVPDPPVPVRWREYFDTRIAAPYRAILSTFDNVTVGALAVGTLRSTDPTSWPPDFTAMLIEALANQFRPLGGMIDSGRRSEQRPGPGEAAENR